jgi:hypothetical protein
VTVEYETGYLSRNVGSYQCCVTSRKSDDLTPQRKPEITHSPQHIKFQFPLHGQVRTGFLVRFEVLILRRPTVVVSLHHGEAHLIIIISNFITTPVEKTYTFVYRCSWRPWVVFLACKYSFSRTQLARCFSNSEGTSPALHIRIDADPGSETYTVWNIRQCAKSGNPLIIRASTVKQSASINHSSNMLRYAM